MTQQTVAITCGVAAGAAIVTATVAVCMATSAKKEVKSMREALKARGIDLDAELAKNPNNSNNANTAAPGQKNNSNNAPQS